MAEGDTRLVQLVVDSAELLIAIRPRGYVEWVGTETQMRGEGLAFPWHEWPDPGRERRWTAWGFDWRLVSAQHSALGRRAGRIEHRWWSLLRREIAHRDDGLAAANWHELQQALAEEARQHTLAAAEARRRWIDAQIDEAFQRFRWRLQI